MKRVLFVDHVDRVLGGAEINLIELIEEARRRGDWEIAVACRSGSRLGQSIAKLGVKQFDYGFGDGLNRLRFAGKSFPWTGLLDGVIALREASRDLETIIDRSEAQFVISCTNKDHLALSGASKRSRSIWWINDLITAAFFPAPARLMLKRSAKKADALIAVSNAVREALGIESARVIHNGISPQKYQSEPGVLRRTLGVAHNEPLFGLIGRITPWKGHELFLEIATRWIEGGRAGRFLIIGEAFNEDGGFEKALRDAVTASHSLSNRVRFLPFQDRLADTLCDLTAILHTSLHPEPFGRVIIEAMAAGTPVIAAKRGGPAEIIQHGKNGLLVEPGVATDYLGQMDMLLKNPDAAAQIAQAARVTVSEKFTVQRVYKEFDALLSGI